MVNLSPANWARVVTFWECPGGTVGNYRGQWPGWLVSRSKQECRPFVDVHDKSGLAIRPCPWTQGTSRSIFSLIAKNGTGWLMNSIQAWQLIAREQTSELHFPHHSFVCHQYIQHESFIPYWGREPLLSFRRWVRIFFFLISGPAQVKIGEEREAKPFALGPALYLAFSKHPQRSESVKLSPFYRWAHWGPERVNVVPHLLSEVAFNAVLSSSSLFSSLPAILTLV